MQRFHVRTTQFHLQDTMSLMECRLSVNAGFKQPATTITATSINPVRAAGTLAARKSFLP